MSEMFVFCGTDNSHWKFRNRERLSLLKKKKKKEKYLKEIKKNDKRGGGRFIL